MDGLMPMDIDRPLHSMVVTEISTARLHGLHSASSATEDLQAVQENILSFFSRFSYYLD